MRLLVQRADGELVATVEQDEHGLQWRVEGSVAEPDMRQLTDLLESRIPARIVREDAETRRHTLEIVGAEDERFLLALRDAILRSGVRVAGHRVRGVIERDERSTDNG